MMLTELSCLIIFIPNLGAIFSLSIFFFLGYVKR
jgi:hypothetical protein